MMILSMMVIIILLVLKSFYYYNELKSEAVYDAKRESHLLQDYMMSMREVFHKQFLSSEIELNDKTLGFLPAHATTLISDKFQEKNNYNFYIRNVSDKPRNKTNMADEEEMKAIKYFKTTPNPKEYFQKYKKDGKEYFQFASPIYIKGYCLACHGKREDALPTIKKRYDNAYDYKVGDVRGIVSIKIPNDKIDNMFWSYLKKELFITSITFMLILIIFFVLFKNVFLNIKNIEKTAIDYASTDALTNLYNRKYLDILKENHHDRVKEAKNYVVAFLDIDFFKKVNDTYGHDVGDLVLKEFASLLLSLSRREDIVCRYGGEEFLVIAYDITKEEAIQKFERVRKRIESKEIVDGDVSLKITISIGLSYDSVGTSIEESITNADLALYKAKENGRNRIEVYNSTIKD